MRLVAVVALAAAASGAAVALARHGPHSSSAAPAAARVSPSAPVVVLGSAVHVDADMAGTSFLPLGMSPVDGHTLSAQHAYNAMLGSPSLAAPIPAGVRAYYGVLSAGSTLATARDLRVWGFAVESGCVYSLGPPASGEPTPSRPERCRHWEFVNARTGRDLGVITQEVLPD